MSKTYPSSGGMDYGIVLPNWIVGRDTEQLVEFAVAAEEAGWDGVCLADHLMFPHGDYDGPDNMEFHDPWITMASIATRTDDITMTSWITPIPRRQPWQLARDLATLDQLSGGRIILGTGLGVIPTNYTPFGDTDDPVTLGQRYDEALDIIAGLWQGEPFSYDGDHYSIDDAVLLPTPNQDPRIPIVAGGVWPHKKPIQRGARWDGIVPHFEGDGVIPGEDDKTPADVVRELLTYYHEHTDDPGEIMLPIDPPESSPEYLDVCQEFGVTWMYTTDLRGSDYVSNPEAAVERINQGPPA